MSARPTHHVLAVLALLVLVAGLAAATPAVAAATSTPADPGLTLGAKPTVVRSGRPAQLTGHIGVPGATLTISRRYAGEVAFTELRTVVAGLDGSVGWSPRPSRTVTYRLDYAGAEGTWTPASAEATVSVRPRIALTVGFKRPLFQNDTVNFHVAVGPAHPGGTLTLQRYTGGTWVDFKTITLGDASRVTASWKPDHHGRLAVRAHMVADADHVAGSSSVWKVFVRDPRNPYNVPYRLPHLILVDLSKYKLYYHEYGHVVRVFDCVLGRPSLPTPKGHFRIYAKDPNMSGPYGPRRMRYLGLYAIHGTDEPWLLDRFPRNYSHGCTRLSNTNILWLYSRVHVGTPVWNVP